MTTTNLLIEGWRGVNHSFALVNQCQILELLQIDGLRLHHRDLPFAMAHWTAEAHDAGFAPRDRERIAALAPPPAGQPVDGVLRLSSPFRADENSPPVRTLTFMVTELGLSARSFEPGCDERFFTRGDNLIVTPTRWARERLVEHGFADARIRTVPHGVRSDTFCPLSAAERAATRSNLGMSADQFVFLNLGAALWNKGVDVLLLAFARLRQRPSMQHTRLLLKDQRALYGVSVDATLADLSARHPALFGADTLAAVQVLPGNLSQAQLRLMYGIADCYASPYRAEGFNLPVLEAIACGTPAIVTDGGATDDYCDADVAIRIASTPGTLDTAAGGAADGRRAPARYRQPDADALLEAMAACASGGGIAPALFAAGRKRLVERLTWRAAAAALHRLLVPQPQTQTQTQTQPPTPQQPLAHAGACA